MTQQRVLRHTVTIDDQPHEIPACPVMLFARGPAHHKPGLEKLLDVWLLERSPRNWPAEQSSHRPMRRVQVAATGQPVPDTWVYLSSCLDGRYVWHLFDTNEDPTQTRSER